jgi:UDPglucose 6-dehydrogenase
MTTAEPKVIWIKGLWHQGLVAAAVFAQRGFRVVGLCDSPSECEALKSGNLPVFEPQLEELIASGIRSRKLLFALMSDSINLAPDYVLIMHDTPVSEEDQVDLRVFWSDVKALKAKTANYPEILITSQVPVGTSREVDIFWNDVSESLERRRVSYMPENLRLGTAISRFQSPELPVVGVNDDRSQAPLKFLFGDQVNLNFCTLEEAELLKSALNGFLALSVTYSNEIFELASKVNASGFRVMELLRSEPRIGQLLPLLPGLPFSGGTLARDVQNLRRASRELNGESPIFEAIWLSNERHYAHFLNFVTVLIRKYKLRRIGLLGLTYKVGTSTLRRSLAIRFASDLQALGFFVLGYDPKQEVFDELNPLNFGLAKNVGELISETDLQILMTPWPEILEYFESNNQGIDKRLIDPYGSLRKLSQVLGANYTHYGASQEANRI